MILVKITEKESTDSKYRANILLLHKLVEKPAEAGGASFGGRLKLCEGDTRIGRAIIIIIIIDYYRTHPKITEGADQSAIGNKQSL